MRLSLLGLTFAITLGLLTQEALAVAPAESKPDTAAKKGSPASGGTGDNSAHRSTGVRMPVARYERDPFHTYRTRYWRFYGPTSRAAKHYVPSRSYGRYSSSYYRRYSSDSYRGYSSPSYRARRDYSAGGNRLSPGGTRYHFTPGTTYRQSAGSSFK